MSLWSIWKTTRPFKNVKFTYSSPTILQLCRINYQFMHVRLNSDSCILCSYRGIILDLYSWEIRRVARSTCHCWIYCQIDGSSLRGNPQFANVERCHSSGRNMHLKKHVLLAPGQRVVLEAAAQMNLLDLLSPPPVMPVWLGFTFWNNCTADWSLINVCHVYNRVFLHSLTPTPRSFPVLSHFQFWFGEVINQIKTFSW